MELYPAIDIRGGRAVRLRSGRFDQQTVYANDPLEAARAWVDGGAQRLHVVDLDGAREGRPVALRHIERIAAQLSVPVQCGGGLRTLADVVAAFDAGAGRVVLGTAAHRDRAFLEQVLDRHADRVAVAVDVRCGRVATDAWEQTTEGAPEAVVAGLGGDGVRTIVYTDADRDGTLEGPDLDAVRRAAEAAGDARLICSGGIGALSDLEALAGLGSETLDGVIVGKALYEGRFTVAQARSAAGETG